MFKGTGLGILWDHERGSGVSPEIPELTHHSHLTTNLGRDALATKYGWGPLHRYGLEHAQTWSPADAQAWFANWELGSVPGDCDCMEHWRRLKASTPPDFASAERFFVWSVNAHNFVNARLTAAGDPRPQFSIDEARARWAAGA